MAGPLHLAQMRGQFGGAHTANLACSTSAGMTASLVQQSAEQSRAPASSAPHSTESVARPPAHDNGAVAARGRDNEWPAAAAAAATTTTRHGRLFKERRTYGQVVSAAGLHKSQTAIIVDWGFFCCWKVLSRVTKRATTWEHLQDPGAQVP